MDPPPDDDEQYKSLAYPVITDEEIANKILDNILQNEFAVIGIDTEAAVEMSRFGILCLLQVIHNINFYIFLYILYRLHTMVKCIFLI